VELQNKKAFSGKDLRLPYVGLEHIAQGAPTLLGTADSSSSVSVNSLFEKDDILFGKLRPNLRKSLRAPFRGYCSTDILVLRCREGIVPGFAGHVFQWQRVFAAASATAAGTRMPRASWDDLKRLYVFAPKSELAQEAIATVLNAVEDAIAKTGAVIVKLRQLRSGMLDDLLTRGLDEKGQLRDPVALPEWFQESPVGRIPKVWRFSAFSEVLDRIDSGKSPDYADCPAPPGEWGLLKVSAIWPEGFRANENKWVTKAMHKNQAYEVQDGDLLISRSNTYALVGLVCLVRKPPPRLLLCDKTLRLRVRLTCASPHFFALLLQTRSARRQIEIHATGTSGSMKNISQNVIRSLKLAYPLPEEQHRVLRELAPLDESLAALGREFDKLTSIKSGLTTDLLTGRVRVPESILSTEAPG